MINSDQSPRVGDPYCWLPAAFTQFSGQQLALMRAADRLAGRVIYVNESHRLFRVEASVPGGVLRECFKF